MIPSRQNRTYIYNTRELGLSSVIFSMPFSWHSVFWDLERFLSASRGVSMIVGEADFTATLGRELGTDE